MTAVHARVLLILVFACFILYPVTAARTAEGSFEGTITRGSRFTVTIIGLPKTAYYIWIPHTSTMSGAPHDQPPVITGSQSDLQQDPPEGPYLIGSYRFSNGGGDTIRDDIPPSTPEMSNTRYYGLVTTDSDGLATVGFLTSFNTAIRSYSVKVENPRSAESDNLLVQIHAYSRTTPPTPVITTRQTQEPSPVTTATTITTTTTAVTVPPGTTTAALQPQTTTQLPTRQTPAETGTVILGVCAALLILAGRKKI